jgi:penicillin G amidase
MVLRFPGTSPLLMRFLALAIAPLLIFGVWAAQQVWASLPDDHVRLTRGVTAPVEIERDRHGVPHIKASGRNDAAFAVGYAQAQDRLWQLEMQRRTTAGRLAEVLGRTALDSDIWHRTLNLRGSAAEAWQRLTPAAQESLTAYSAGINTRLQDGSPLPPEFQMLGVVPEPWTPLDSLAWMKSFALDLGGNMDRELDYAIALQWLGTQRTAALFPGYSRTQADTAVASLAGDPSGATQLRAFRAKLALSSRRFMTGAGSNAWAVSGRWTGTGTALLANDPHLGLSIPSVWYAQSVQSPDWEAAGMAIVGTPMIIFGHNQAIAWAGTNMMADAQDLFEERISEDGRHYLSNGGWRPLRERIETIAIRSDWPAGLHPQLQPVQLKARSTAHGPLISDVVPKSNQQLALRWTGLDQDDSSYEAFYRINHARDWIAFRTALRSLVAPALNFLFADRNGRIGFQSAGRIPVRSLGNGHAPVPGWTAEWRWTGEAPREALPANWEPAADVLVSANQAPAAATGFHISSDWASPARAQRIAALLTAIGDRGRPATVEDMSDIQRDVLDLDAVRLMRRLRPWLQGAAADPRLIQIMAQWQGEMAGDSSGAAIFRMWTHFIRAEFADLEPIRPLPGGDERQRFDRVLRTVDLRTLDRMLAVESGWCGASGSAGCSALAQRALVRAEHALVKLTGVSEPAGWQLNEIQEADFVHAPFSATKPLDRIFGRRIGTGGSENSISAASSYFLEGEGFRQNFGSGFRQIFALHANQLDHWYMLSTGQSGIVVSGHYADMLEPFAAFQLYRLDQSNQPSTQTRGAAP